jgi:hypothetical protein
MITGFGKYWKWFQCTENTGVYVGLHRYFGCKGGWDYEILPRLSVGKITQGAAIIYNLRIMLWNLYLAIDIEKLRR